MAEIPPRVTAQGSVAPMSHALELAGRKDGKHLIINGVGTIRITIREGKIIWAWLWEDPFGRVYHWQAQPLGKPRRKRNDAERTPTGGAGIWPN